MTAPGVLSDMKLDVVCFRADCGLGDYSVSLCRELARHASTRLVTSQSLDPRFESLGFEVLRSFRRTRHLPVDIFFVLRSILRRRPDAVIFQSWLKAPLLERFLVGWLRRRGIRCFITVHDVLPHHPRPWSKPELAFYFRGFDGLIAHSDRAMAQLVAMGVSAPILVVPHGAYDLFDTLHLDRAQARRHLPYLDEKSFVVLFFGKLDVRKGILEFVEASRRFDPADGVQFLAAGVNGLGRQEAESVRKAADGKVLIVVDRRIPFDEVQYFFAACDTVAVPYREGTTSGVAKLAIAFSRPIMATPIGDLVETVGPGVGLLLQGVDTAAALADAITGLKAADLSPGSNDAGDRYSWPGIASRYFDFVAAPTAQDRRI